MNISTIATYQHSENGYYYFLLNSHSVIEKIKNIKNQYGDSYIYKLIKSHDEGYSIIIKSNNIIKYTKPVQELEKDKSYNIEAKTSVNSFNDVNTGKKLKFLYFAPIQISKLNT